MCILVGGYLFPPEFVTLKSVRRLKKSRVHVLGMTLSCNNLGQVVHTHVPLSGAV